MAHDPDGKPAADGSAFLMKGLTGQEVLAQRELCGENLLPVARGRSAGSILIAQFINPLIYIILVAAAISLLMGETGDFFIIMVVVAIDVALGFAQEYRAHRTYQALKRMVQFTAAVIRDGVRQEIDVRELVPGDLAILKAGDRVPGDGVILSGTKLSLDEAILTGESEPVGKTPGSGENDVFMGTTVVTGRGYMKVRDTGTRTQLGQIAASQQEIRPEKTPLQARLGRFSRTLTYLVIGVTLMILTTGLLAGREPLDMVRVSIVLAIAAVPEALPIAVTVIQVIGMRNILKRNGLVERLSAVETLGSVTVICTDKTGTLTEGHMRVVRSSFADVSRGLETIALCNNLEGPVDAALWEFAQAGPGPSPREIADSGERLSEQLFTSETKYMATRNLYGGEILVYLKGAPEIILAMCDLDEADREEILAKIDDWARSGLRLLGFAYKTGGWAEDTSGFTWNGLVGMEDPIREGVQEAIAVARQAGVKIKMITGDYRLTAERIAQNLGLLSGGAQVMEGHEMNQLDDQEFKRRVDATAVFARIRPFDKLRIISALQENGEITAMIGDGVNDAPALQRADIGVVVGSATDVARETADLILLDNNFKTIVAAIEEGRVIFENIQKVVAYVLSNSFAEILTIFAAMMVGWPTPLLVAQILWIHLICDGPADIMLGFEPKEDGIMEQRPKSLQEPVLTPLGLSLIAVISTASAAAALCIFGNILASGGNIDLGRSHVFAIFAVNSMIYIFAYRSLRTSICRGNRLLSNKPLLFSALGGLLMALGVFVIPAMREILGLVPLGRSGYAMVFGIAFAMLLVVEAGKAVNNRLQSACAGRRDRNRG